MATLGCADHVDCAICLEQDVALSLTHAVQGCGHRFCRACLTAYVQSQLQEDVYPIKCPQAECSVDLGPAQRQGLQLSEDESAKLLEVRTCC